MNSQGGKTKADKYQQRRICGSLGRFQAFFMIALSERNNPVS
jgi:hypothetical protein